MDLTTWDVGNWAVLMWFFIGGASGLMLFVIGFTDSRMKHTSLSNKIFDFLWIPFVVLALVSFVMFLWSIGGVVDKKADVGNEVLSQKFGVTVPQNTGKIPWGSDETFTIPLRLSDNSLASCVVETFPNPQDTKVFCDDNNRELPVVTTWNPTPSE